MAKAKIKTATKPKKKAAPQKAPKKAPKKVAKKRAPERVKKSTPSEWGAVARGAMLSTMISKHVNYIGFADSRAQGIITINAFLIPVAFAGFTNPIFTVAVVIVVITAALSIITAIISLYPRHYSHHDTADHLDLFHFVPTKEVEERTYLNNMSALLSETGALTEDISRDLYHIQKLIVAPKFRWLKVSYFVFAIGNSIALLAVLFAVI